MTHDSDSNSDRLRELQGGESGKKSNRKFPTIEPMPPKSTSIGPHTPARQISTQNLTQSSRQTRKSILIGLALVGGLFLTSLIVALLVRHDANTLAETFSEDSSLSYAPEGGSIYDRPLDVPGLLDATLRSTVTIWCDVDDAFGSGFVFDLASLTGTSNRVVVTNHHLIEACIPDARVEVSVGRRTLIGELNGWDADADIALISVQGLVAPPLEPNFEPQIGQWVMAAGAPAGIEGSASFGYITNIVPERYMLTSDAVIAAGSSGGPLVDNQGRVVGVNFAVWEDATGISLSSSIDAMCRFILDC